MIKALILVLMATLSFTASAHVEPGNYTGIDQNGAACSFTVLDMWFEDNMHHPLTERLPVTDLKFATAKVEAVIWNLGHPPVVNTELGLNRYNHGLFQQIVPTKVGAASVTLLKKDDKEGEDDGKPVGVIYIEDNYRNKAESKKVTCLL